MNHNFDEIINRKNTNSLKYDFALRRGKPEGVLPLWVADMDFQAPSCVIDALVEKSRHGVFGYSESGDDYFEALRNWFSSNLNWNVQPEWLTKTPGVVYAISAAIRAFTSEGDAVLIQQPVYYPFTETITDNNRKFMVNQLRYSGGKYYIDFDDFEGKIVKNNVRMFILCSPHNPVGRVWAEEELVRMGCICLKYDVMVVADEIHADFTYPGLKHLVFAGLSPEFADRTITCTAPTKTFNLAGLQISNIFISNRNIRNGFRQEINRTGYSQVNIMGMIACKAAYIGGREWFEALKIYLSNNLAFVRSFLKERLPKIKLVEPEGTYLVWLDFSGLELSDKDLDRLIVHKAGLWLDSGTMFGAGGEGFQRINIACPLAVLEKAFNQLEKALSSCSC